MGVNQVPPPSLPPFPPPPLRVWLALLPGQQEQASYQLGMVRCGWVMGRALLSVETGEDEEGFQLIDIMRPLV